MIPAITSTAVRHTRTRRWAERLARWLTAIATASLMVSCGAQTDQAQRGADIEAGRVETQIAADLQGAQLDVWGGGEPSAGGTTSMFIHRGNRAVEVYWTTDGWCVARLFTWSVEHTTSPTRFDVRYDAVRHFPDCVADTGDDVTLEVYDVESSPGSTTLLGAYPALDATWTERTVCTTRWDAKAPCGFPAAAAAADRWL